LINEIVSSQKLISKKYGVHKKIEFNSNLLTNIPLEKEDDTESNHFPLNFYIVQQLTSLSTYLKTSAIDSLILESLLVHEGGPTDSTSLTACFH